MKIDSRITLIDALRGYALMGLFLIHMVEYYELYWYRWFSDPINTIVFAIFGGKAYAIFSFLFGFSFYLMMQKHADRGTDFSGRFMWRLLLLYCLGFAHTLIYGGDILQILAVCGFILVPLWRTNTKIILTLAVLLLAQTPALGFIQYLSAHPEFEYKQPIFTAFQKPVYDAYANGSLWDVVRENAWDGMKVKWLFAWEFGRLANIIGLGMLGFLAGRIGFFVEREKFHAYYVAGLVISILMAIVLYYSEPIFTSLPHPVQAGGIIKGMVDNYINLMLTFVSILIFVLAYQFKLGVSVLKHLAPAGRMTLTLYVLQSCIFVPFYYGFGFNAYTFISQAAALMIGLIAWIITLVAARWWFLHFRMGPLEWLWRAGTFMRTDIPFRGAAKE
jgi:uncharacterized protein